jgi:hypothetical protein
MDALKPQYPTVVVKIEPVIIRDVDQGKEAIEAHRRIRALLAQKLPSVVDEVMGEVFREVSDEFPWIISVFARREVEQTLPVGWKP